MDIIFLEQKEIVDSTQVHRQHIHKVGAVEDDTAMEAACVWGQKDEGDICIKQKPYQVYT